MAKNFIVRQINKRNFVAEVMVGNCKYVESGRTQKGAIHKLYRSLEKQMKEFERKSNAFDNASHSVWKKWLTLDRM